MQMETFILKIISVYTSWVTSNKEGNIRHDITFKAISKRAGGRLLKVLGFILTVTVSCICNPATNEP